MGQNYDQAKRDNTFWPRPNILHPSVTVKTFQSIVSFSSAQVLSSYGLEPSDSSKLSTYSSLMRYLFVSPFWPFKPFWPFMPFWPFWTWSSFFNTSFSRHLSLAWVHFWTFLACRIQRLFKNKIPIESKTARVGFFKAHLQHWLGWARLGYLKTVLNKYKIWCNRFELLHHYFHLT